MLEKLIDIQKSLDRLAEKVVGDEEDLRKLEHITMLTLEGKLQQAYTAARALEAEMARRMPSEA